MIKIIAKITVKEELIKDFQETARELVEKSSAEEGNVSYSLNQNIKNPQEHVFVEIWKSQEAIESHNASEHFTGIFPKLATMAEGETSVELYTDVFDFVV